MYRILIADDHAIVRRGLREILTEQENFAQCEEVETGLKVLERVRQKDWDVVILDISLPDKSGLDVLKEVKTLKPGIFVLVLSVYPESQYAVRVLKSGASGYLTKDSAPAELLIAVKKVVEGGKYVSASLAEKLATQLGGEEATISHETLSDREYQVMCLLGKGRSVADIGKELHLSVKTISTYRTRVLEKMQLTSNAELIHYAIKNSLLR